MVTKNQKTATIAILSFSILFMGVVGVGSALSVIGSHFPDVSQTSVQLIVSLPSIMIIFATLLAGKLQEYFAKRTIAYVGILLFFAAGVAPAFIDNFPLILVMRAVFGVGVGFLQPMSSALIEELFDGEKRDKVMGWQSSAQMIGTAAMSFIGGQLGARGWNLSFLVYCLAIIPLVLVPLLLPKGKPARKNTEVYGEKAKVTLTRGAVGWAVVEFLYFMVGQVNAIFNAYLITEKGLGGAAELGTASLFSAVTGFTMGVLYGRLRRRTGHATFAFGAALLIIADLIIAFATQMWMFYIASMFAGAAFATIIPSMVIGAASSVDKFSRAMAISLAMCTKSIGQFISAYVFTPVAKLCSSAFGGGMNQWVYIISAVYLLVLGGVMLIFGVRKNRQEKAVLPGGSELA